MDTDKLKALQITRDARQRRHRSVWIIFLGVALFTAAGAYYAWPRKEDNQRIFSRPKSRAGESTNPPTSSNAPPIRADGVVLTVSGYIVNRERIELSPRFLGQVQWIGVRKGDTVTNGQVLVRLDDSEQKARLHEAESRLANTRVALEKAQLDYERIRKLIADKIETRQNEDDLRLRVEAARATIKEAEALVELMQTYLSWTVIRSPIDGVVLEKLADENELVTPQSFGGTRGPSTALVAIADPKELQVEIELNESDLAKVFVGQQCRVSPEAFPDKSYAGFVAEMAPEASRQKGTLQIKVQIRNPDRFLTPELSAKVEFLSRS
jgi:HlyD family secretion protein